MRNTSHRYYFEGTTTEEKMNRFDIPIHGLTEEYPDVFEQVKLANLRYKKGDFTIAAQIWENAADVGNDEAAYRLAKMLKETESYPMQRLERFRKSERLLRALWNRYSDYRIDLELADLYYRCGMGKYASALGHLLRAKLNGAQVEAELVEAYQKRLSKESVDVSNDPHGAYLLGCALVDSGAVEKGVYFLEQAIEYGRNSKWIAYAALELAQACEGCRGYERLRYSALKQAEDLGFPEVLCPKKQEYYGEICTPERSLMWNML